MKKIVSIILCVLLLASCAFTGSAAEEKTPVTRVGSKVPVVLVGGDGDKLVDENGKEVFRFLDLGNAIGDTDTETIKESVLNVVKPLLVQGMLTGNFDPYYEALYNEVAEMFSDVLLDENGEPKNGSGITDARKEEMRVALSRDQKKYTASGTYELFNYHFWYDWRLDPLYTADLLNDYIEQVKAVTGQPKVALLCRCVGSNVVLSYISKYGTSSLYSLGMCGVVGMNGSEPMSESISGKFSVNLPAIDRLIYDLNALGYLDLDPFVNSTLELLAAGGMTNAALAAAKATIYRVIVQGATSSLALSTFFSCPMYWACVNAKDYEDAKLYVFGPEGSEKRQQYAGLIEKIDAYDAAVRQKLPALLEEVRDTVDRVCIISKYGYQLSPVCESADVLSDQIASVYSSSFGATTSLAYDTLSDEYIASRVAAGYGDYISPDLQVDASTCLFPEQTWFAKGATHSNWTKGENALLYTVTTSEKVLTTADTEIGRFFVEDNETGDWQNMTVENCNTYHWNATPEAQHPQGFIARLRAFIRALRVWLSQLKVIIRERLASKD